MSNLLIKYEMQSHFYYWILNYIAICRNVVFLLTVSLVKKFESWNIFSEFYLFLYIHTFSGFSLFIESLFLPLRRRAHIHHHFTSLPVKVCYSITFCQNSKDVLKYSLLLLLYFKRESSFLHLDLAQYPVANMQLASQRRSIRQSSRANLFEPYSRTPGTE